jgi:hypothetical protein
MKGYAGVAPKCLRGRPRHRRPAPALPAVTPAEFPSTGSKIFMMRNGILPPAEAAAEPPAEGGAAWN